MQYNDSVHYLYSLGNEVQTAKLGLERISALLEALGNPHRSFKSIHVAGTNGKGSTCAMIEAGLRARGRKTGLYTSPHLVKPTERIQIGGVPVDQEEFAASFTKVHQAAEKMLASGALDLHPTYFETVTAMAFLLFQERRVEIAVLETGLGGRLDATNVVRPEVCVITQIDYDHQNFLGETIEEIAAEKAGILKPDVFAVFAAQRPEAMRVLIDKSEELNCPVVLTSDWRIQELALRSDGCRIRTDGVTIDCPLAGEHQVENALAAAIALDLLGVDPGGIAQTVWPGRLELVHRNPDIILDGAHNPAGARALAAYIGRFYSGRRLWLVFASMRDKPFGEMAGVLFPLATQVFLTSLGNTRAIPAKELKAYAHESAVVVGTVTEAVALALAAPPEAAVFFAGSLFLAGEARGLLKLQ